MLGGGDLTWRHDLALSRNIKTIIYRPSGVGCHRRINRQLGEFEYEPSQRGLNCSFSSIEARVTWDARVPRLWRADTELWLKFKTETTIWIVNLDLDFLRLALHLLMRLKPALCLLERQEVLKRSKIRKKCLMLKVLVALILMRLLRV